MAGSMSRVNYAGDRMRWRCRERVCADFFAGVARDIVDDVDPIGISPRKFEHMPVPSEHDPVKFVCIDSVLDIGRICSRVHAL